MQGRFRCFLRELIKNVSLLTVFAVQARVADLGLEGRQFLGIRNSVSRRPGWLKGVGGDLCLNLVKNRWVVFLPHGCDDSRLVARVKNSLGKQLMNIFAILFRSLGLGRLKSRTWENSIATAILRNLRMQEAAVGWQQTLGFQYRNCALPVGRGIACVRSDINFIC